MTNYINLVGAEIEKQLQILDQVPESVGMFSIKTANRTVKEASQRPNPDPLWLSLWYEGECCCLFSDSNLGKSIYAVQIATDIAKKQRVIYFDLELSDKQFQLRYTDDNGVIYEFPPNFYRAEIDQDALTTANFEDSIIADIESAVVKTSARVIIIDNLTYLCNSSEKGDAAGILMMRLVQLKRKYNLSILVIAHTPKRPLSAPITQNDLAGSKKLYNFFDSVFAIGKSAKDENLRYVKQVKCRYGAFEYDSENVILYSIEKTDSFLHFQFMDFVTEREHLKEPEDGDRAALAERAKEEISKGKTYRETAKELGISLAKVQRLIKVK